MLRFRLMVNTYAGCNAVSAEVAYKRSSMNVGNRLRELYVSREGKPSDES